jgi:hypothetical protein
MQIYNATTNTWTQGAPLPAARSGAAVAAFGGKVYIIGGFTIPFPTGTNTVYEYDPVTNTYLTKTPWPGTATGNLSGVVYNGEIYVVGGSVAASLAYNPVTDTWRTLAPFPQADCQSNAVFEQGGLIWSVGCLNRPVLTQQVFMYNPGTNTWSVGNPLYTVDHQGPGAATYNGRSYVVGGGTAGGGSTAVESLGGGGGGCPSPTVVPGTATRTNTPPATATRTNTVPATVTRTNTVPPTITPPATVTRTGTVIVPTNTNTPVSTSTRTNTVPPPVTGTATSTRTPCGEPCTLSFTDVPPSYTFYNNIQCLVCRGVISGYPCGGVNPETGQPEPCDGQQRPYFLTENRINRGQKAKIVDISQ